MHVSADYFRTLGVQPLLGRALDAGDNRLGAEPVMVLGEALWRGQFRGDPEVLGRRLRAGDHEYVVVGVVPDSAGLLWNPELWLPLAPVAASIGQGSNYKVIGRLPQGLAPAAVDSQLVAVSTALMRELDANVRPVLTVRPLLEAFTRAAERPLYLLYAAVGLLLMIAAANTANLLLARVSARARELSIRAALGGSARALAGTVLSEAVLLAVAGAVLGWLGAQALLDVLLSLRSEALPRQDAIQVDIHALAYALLVSLVCAVLASAPALWLAARVNLAPKLRSGSAGSGVGKGALGLRRGLLVAQVALSLVLLVGAALLVQSYRNLSRVDMGFPLERTLAAEFWGSTAEFSIGSGHMEQLIDATSRLPGVKAVGVVAAGLPGQSGGNTYVTRQDQPDLGASVDMRAVSPGYFPALGIQLLQGRLLDSHDQPEAQLVAVVSRGLARQLYADADPLGAEVIVHGQTRRIVGIVSDLLSVPGQAPAPTVLLPIHQADPAMLKLFEGWFPTHLVVASAGSAEALIPSVARLLDAERGLAGGRVRSMSTVFAQAISAQRFQMTLLSAFAGLSLLLAAVGVYGVLSFVLQSQSRALGIRAALGASRVDLLVRSLRSGMLPVLTGVAAGLIGAWIASSYWSDLLYGVDGRHAPTVITALLLLLAAALLACLRPALRAMASDPAQVLRAD